jgi:hypothetical protein
MKPSRPTDQQLGGMTVNERLVLCALIDSWDAAVAKRDREEMIAVRRQVEMTGEQAGQTADAVIKNPAKYGF